jgi:hypothetical protein
VILPIGYLFLEGGRTAHGFTDVRNAKLKKSRSGSRATSICHVIHCGTACDGATHSGARRTLAEAQVQEIGRAVNRTRIT